MAEKKKKKKKKQTSAQMHRTVKDSLMALPIVIEQEQKKGKKFKAFMLRWVTGPMLRVMNKTLDATRYRGKEGEKLKQSEQMRRHLEHRQTAIRHMQGMLQEQQRKQRRGKPM